ncbi:unnamed protein product [Arctogadus glacialis]
MPAGWFVVAYVYLQPISILIKRVIGGDMLTAEGRSARRMQAPTTFTMTFTTTFKRSSPPYCPDRAPIAPLRVGGSFLLMGSAAYIRHMLSPACHPLSFC